MTSEVVSLGHVLTPGEVRRIGPAFVLAHRRTASAPEVVLGEQEVALLNEMPWPHRRAEWLSGRAVAKALLEAVLGVGAKRTQVVPLASGAPRVLVDAMPLSTHVLSLSHTKQWVVAALAPMRLGVDVCDDVDGERLGRIRSRVFSEGEAEALDAFSSAQRQASIWALKEAGLKLFIGGVFDPGARAIFVESLEPPRVRAPHAMTTQLLRLPTAAVALAFEDDEKRGELP